MKSYNFFFKIYLIFYLFFPNIAYAIQNSIIANVDNQIITSFELKNKILTILLLSNQDINQNNINLSKNEAMKSLINIKLKKNEIIKYNVKQSKQRVDVYLQSTSSRFNTNVQGLKNIFENSNINYDLFVEELDIEFKWQKLIFELYKDKIDTNINKDEIDKEINIIIKNQTNIDEYKLAEIEITFKNNEEANRKIIEIKDQISKIGFKNTAIKFSSSLTSLEGGDLGWISSKSLSNKVLKAVKQLNIGNVSEAIFQANSVLFIKLSNKRVIQSKDLDINKIKDKIILSRRNEILNLLSANHLSKVKNQALIEIKK
jgi:peptidyl-prolyl cis-trans isomerase SurA